jgi:hypothetical protein
MGVGVMRLNAKTDGSKRLCIFVECDFIFSHFFFNFPPPFFFLKRELSAQVSPEVHHDCALLCSLRGERLDAQR